MSIEKTLESLRDELIRTQQGLAALTAALSSGASPEVAAPPPAAEQPAASAPVAESVPQAATKSEVTRDELRAYLVQEVSDMAVVSTILGELGYEKLGAVPEEKLGEVYARFAKYVSERGA